MAQVTLPYTLTAGTPENVNNLVANLNALVAGINTVDTAQIASSAVTTAKIADANVTTAKLATGATSATYVTSLPSSPVDGQEIYFAANAADGVIWHLRYRSGASGNYKWDFVGGSPLASAVNTTARTITNQTAYGYIHASDRLSLSLPTGIAGDFDITLSANVLVTNASGILPAVYLSYTTNSAADNASDSWSIKQVVADNGGGTCSFTYRHTSLAAAATIREQGKTDGNYSGSFSNRQLIIRPVRVGSS